MTDDIRTQVMDALLARIESVCHRDFMTYSRRFLTWQDLAQVIAGGDKNKIPKQPALYLFDGIGLGGGFDKVEARGRGTPSVITMIRTIVVYAQFPGGGTPQGIDTNVPGGSVFYPLIASLERAFAPGNGPDYQVNTLTLNGLVSHCWIEGDVHFVTGELDQAGQGMMTVPVNIMLLPNAL